MNNYTDVYSIIQFILHSKVVVKIFGTKYHVIDKTHYNSAKQEWENLYNPSWYCVDVVLFEQVWISIWWVGILR